MIFNRRWFIILTIMVATQTINKKTDTFSQILKDEPDLASFIKDGDLIEVQLLARMPKVAYFDLGKFGTGIVYGQELANSKDVLKNISIGGKVSAKIIFAENDNGYVELSLAGAHKQKGWQELKESVDKEEILTIKITGANSGGLVADINEIKAFLPVSQLSNANYPRVESGDKNEIIKELRKLVGQELKVKIIDLNPRANKLIVSERAAQEEDIKKLLEAYKIGDIVDVIVSGVANFGVFARFADNPAIEGFIHISEIDYRIIDNPKEIVKINDAVKVKILEIKEGQVFLSLKALKVDPWQNVAEKFKEGQEITGKVYRFNPIGAVISLDADMQGLIHISEFGGTEEMKKQLEIEKEYQFMIDSIKLEEKRIFLKLKK